MVTQHGVRFALKNLPALKVLRCKWTLQVVAEMSAERGLLSTGDAAVRTAIHHHLPLEELYCDSRSELPYVTGCFASAIQLCPNLHTVTLSYLRQATDQDFQDLLAMENLVNLSLEELSSISFDGGLLPILTKFGSKTLEKLSLLDFQGPVNVAAILETCPNLRHLKLSRCELFSSPSDHRPRLLLDRLEHLTIVGRGGNSLVSTSAALSILLASCPIVVVVDLYGLNELTDGVLHAAAEVNGFRQLKELNTIFCDFLTTKSVDLLLGLGKSRLNKIYIRYCYQLSNNPAKRDEWENLIRSNNLDLILKID